MPTLTNRQLTEKFWPELEDWQHDANVEFIEGLWNLTSPGGIWMCPAALTIFTKTEDGWSYDDERIH